MVASGSPIIFTTVLLKHRDGSGAPLTDDLRRHARIGDHRLAHDQSFVSIEQPNPVDLHGVPDIARKGLHLEHRSGFHSILFSARLNDSVHVRPSPRQQNVSDYHSGK